MCCRCMSFYHRVLYRTPTAHPRSSLDHLRKCFYCTTSRVFYLEQFVQNERIRKVANMIGVHTLQIYTLHYFVMSTIRLLWNADILINKHLTWVEWVISPVLALMIAYICIYLTRILKFIRLDFVFGR